MISTSFALPIPEDGFFPTISIREERGGSSGKDIVQEKSILKICTRNTRKTKSVTHGEASRFIFAFKRDRGIKKKFFQKGGDSEKAPAVCARHYRIRSNVARACTSYVFCRYNTLAVIHSRDCLGGSFRGVAWLYHKSRKKKLV